ncbi:MAG: glycosyltransferase [Bacteroidetes bacterium]|nr:glycosyltransferase [Bacteroidota bacterium]
MEIAKDHLCIFTINFPLGKEEVFLYDEVMRLSEKFSCISLFPMQNLDSEPQFILPSNVKIIRCNIFKPYNRIKILMSKFPLIGGIYFLELLFSENRVKYLSQFFNTLNNITHKISSGQALVNELNKISTEKLICYSYWFNQWTLTLSLVKKKRGQINLYTRIHGMDVYEEQHTEPDFFFQFRRFQLKQINKVLAISTNGMNHLLNANKIDTSKVTVCRLGVIDNGLNKEEQLPFFRLVSCSAFQTYKRVHLIIDILKHTHLQVEWLHFGDGELKESILKSAENLPANVTFNWMGHKNNKDIITYYQTHQVDLFINTSSTEGIPVSIMEAISFGIPAIAPSVGGVSEIVNKETGYLIEKDFDPKNVADLIESHHKLSNDAKMIKRQQARKYYLDNYSAEKNYSQLAKILKSECAE